MTIDPELPSAHGTTARQDATTLAFIALADELEELVYVWRGDGEMAWMNKASARVSGFTLEELRFRNVENPIIHPDDLPHVLEHLAAFQSSDALTSRPLVNRFFDVWGRTHTISTVHLKSLWEGAPALLAVSRICRPGAINETDATYRRLVESSRDGILTVSRDGRVLFSNHTFQGMVGLPAVELAKRTLAQLLIGEDGQAAERQLAALGTPGVASRSWEARLAPREGLDARWVELTVSRIEDDDGSESRLAVVRDIHEARRLAERIRSSQRLESLGLLAGGIAHDFNNILTGVLANASVAMTLAVPNSALEERVSDIRAAGERAAILCRALLAYVGQAPATFTVLDMDQLVWDTVRMVTPLTPAQVAMERLPAGEPLLVRGDVAQLGQVVLNLLTNAVEAIGERTGRIVVETGVAEAPVGGSGEWHFDEPRSGRHVRVCVRDSGVGMSPEVRARIFDPFFTTKSTGRGLGLSAILGIVRAHGGCLRIDSHEGRGTCFEVWLPEARGAPGAGREPADPVPTPAAKAGSGLVLIVDDDPALRRVAQVILEGAGYRTAAAADGERALQMFGREPGAFVAVVIDQIMPGLRGDEVIQRLRILSPGLPVVHTSGYSDGRDRFTDRVVSLPKPYDAGQLVAALAHALLG